MLVFPFLWKIPKQQIRWRSIESSIFEYGNRQFLFIYWCKLVLDFHACSCHEVCHFGTMSGKASRFGVFHEVTKYGPLFSRFLPSCGWTQFCPAYPHWRSSIPLFFRSPPFLACPAVPVFQASFTHAASAIVLPHICTVSKHLWLRETPRKLFCRLRSSKGDGDGPKTTC